jgi:hypothetical protein
MRSNRFLSGCAIFASLALTQSFGGWTGQMNGTGFGRAGVNVTSATGSFGSAATPLMVGPSAAMVPQAGFAFGAPLPGGSSASTTARIKGSAGYIWQATTLATGGDKTDNHTIESLVNVIPQAFAFLSVDTLLEDGPNGPLLRVSGVATGGTAAFLRGFHWLGDEPPTDEELDTLPALFDPLFSEMIIGKGVLDPTVDSREAFFSLSIPLPPNIPQEKLFVFIDGFATSQVPDAGPMGLAFGLTVAGLAWARRFKQPA